MRYGRSSGGLDKLFPRGRPGIATLLVAIWAGFMVATAGAAIYPPVTGLVTPLVCQGQADTESHHFSTRPGESITTRQFNCIGPDGKPESIMAKTLAATFVAYALSAFVLLTLVGLWRGRGAAAAAAASSPGTTQRPRPADPLADFITRPAFQPRAPADEGETTRRLAELKRLYDSGLIAEDDYEGKKAEILSRL
jgi:hypothetical protein